MSKRVLLGLFFAVLAAGCSHGGSSMLPGGSSPTLLTPKSISPALVSPAPMAQTAILPASAMKSPVHPDIAVPPLNWTPIPGSASVVAASPDGSLWVLSDQPSGPDKFIWHYSGGTWSNISGLASNLSVASDGSLWAINSGGGIYHYSGGTWTSPGGGASNSITADGSGGVYVLSNGGTGPDRAIWHYSSGTGWVQQGGSGTALAANLDTNTFSPGSGTLKPGGFYILNSIGGIWYENSDGSYVQFPGSASGIAPTTNGGFFVLGYPSAASGNQVFYYDLNTPGWTGQNGAGLMSISANNSNLYLTSSSGAIYSAPVPSNGPLVTAAVVGPGGSASSTVTLGTPSTIALTLVAKDVNGKTISGAYGTTVTFANLDALPAGTGSTSLNVASVSSSGTTITLTYNGSMAFAGTRIRAIANGSVVGSFLVTGPCTLAAGVSRQGYYPCDLQSAYNLTSSSASNGSDQTVAIVDAFDDPNAESDLAIYRNAFGLPPCTTANGCFSKRTQNGSSTNFPVPDAGWALEMSLDLDMVSAICPKCHILLVEASTNSNSDLYFAENEAVTLGATEISNSWGGNESFVNIADEQNYFKHPGIPITASSGDNAYAGGVSFPASSQYVTAVGGTALVAATNGRGWSETVWGDTGTGGAGSGCSLYIAKPAWQTDPSCSKRMVSDVSAVADPNTAVWIYDTYQSAGWGRVGGTSASSPIIASVYAISGNASSVVYGSYAYSHTGSLFDITSGTNGLGTGTCNGDPLYYCIAQVGYDGPTGLGTPNGATGAFIRPMERALAPAPLTNLNYHPGPSRHACPEERRPGFAQCFAIERTD
jgi:archaellum component FlaF (FlaF/FlaG flagellin family)